MRIFGKENAIRDESGMASHLTEWRGRYRGKAAVVLGDVEGALRPRARVLDVGCSNGDTVCGWLDLGYDA